MRRATKLTTAAIASGAMLWTVAAFASEPASDAGLGQLSSRVISVDTSPSELAPTGFLSPQSGDDPLSGYTDLDDAIAQASLEMTAEQDLAKPVVVPEPSAFALLACLGCLLLAMTLMRWHFDRATSKVAVPAGRS